MTFEILDKDRDEFNSKLDGWYNLGVNIIPMNTSVNIPVIDEWIPWRDKRIPSELYEYWKKEHLFDKGAAALLGRAWGKEQLVGKNKDKDNLQYYLWCIDCDSNGALDEIGILDNIKSEFIIERHKDELSTGHIFGFSTYQLPSKRLVDGNLIIEVFGESKHLMNISPSIHKNGFPWERPENCTTIPSVSDNIADYIDKIFRRHGQEYLSANDNGNGKGPVSRIGKPKITTGNRHVELRSLICSLISKNSNGFDKELLRKFAYEINETECETPLPEKEINELYDSCWTFIESRKIQTGQGQESEYGKITRDVFEAELVKKYHFKATKDTEDLYYYDYSQGIFVKGGEWMIKSESLKYNPGINTSTVEQIRAHIIWGNYIDRTDFDPEIEWLCCKNVMVNLLTGETKQHSPDFMATVQIPHDYSLESDAADQSPPKIMEFLNQVMGAEDIETVLDFMAYCLWRAFPYHRWLLLNGSGRNGKGVTTNLITNLLGTKNVSSETLHRLLDNKFASGNLYGKMANIDADLSSQALKQTGLLKKITGADEIPGEFKFKPAFFFRNHAKLIFSANTMPISPDETDAFFARLLIINFPNQFLGDKANPNLIEELTTEKEMSALLGLVVRRLPRVLKEGISYTASHTIEDNYLRYIRSSDPIRYFSETAIRGDTDVKAYVTKTDMYEAYIKFCDKNKLNTESSYTFSRELKKHGYYDIQVRIGGKKEPRIRVWRNVKLINWEKPEDDDQEVLDL